MLRDIWREGVLCKENVEYCMAMGLACFIETVNGVKIIRVTIDELLVVEEMQVIELLYSLLYSLATSIDIYYPPMLTPEARKSSMTKSPAGRL
jgi:hypothetical protein